MTIENNLKNLLGEYAFQICILNEQLADRDAQIAELEKTKKKNEK